MMQWLNILMISLHALSVATQYPHQTATNEIWIVERHGEFPNNSIRFKRPDNSYVIPFEK